MKMSKIGLVALVLLGFAFLAPVPVRAASQQFIWLNTLPGTHTMADPLGLFNAYTTGSTATFQALVNNPSSGSVKVIYAQLGMDWGTNYTASAISNTSPLTIPAGGQGLITFSFSVPSTSVASNIVEHNPISGPDYFDTWSFFNVSTTVCQGGPGGSAGHECPFGFIPFSGSMSVYTTDQAAAIAALQPIQQIVNALGSGTVSFQFNTTQARYDALQATVQYLLGRQNYGSYNFNASKTNWNGALTWWNAAVTAQNNTETSHTNTVNSNTTTSLNNAALGGYGTILLGAGIVLAGAGVLVYGIRRPKAAMAPH